MLQSDFSFPGFHRSEDNQLKNGAKGKSVHANRLKVDSDLMLQQTRPF